MVATDESTVPAGPAQACELVAMDEAAAGYYGADHFRAWARKTDKRWPYPYVLGRELPEGRWMFDAAEALAHITYLWEVVHEWREASQVPEWWVWLIDHADEHLVHGAMLDHLDDIARRQWAEEHEDARG